MPFKKKRKDENLVNIFGGLVLRESPTVLQKNQSENLLRMFGVFSGCFVQSENPEQNNY